MPMDRTDTAGLILISSASFADFFPELGECWACSFLLSAFDFLALLVLCGLLLELADRFASFGRLVRGGEVIALAGEAASASASAVSASAVVLPLSTLLVCDMKRLLARKSDGKRAEPC
jgi:hypothetical protein